MIRPNPSPLLRLPAEIRLIIWESLYLPSARTNPAKTASQNRDVEKPWTVHIKSIDPEKCAPSSSLRRSSYLVRAARFRSRTMRTTYALDFSSDSTTPRSEAYPFIDAMSLLYTCKQLHAEVASLLYSSYIFSFAYSTEAIVPFLSDLTPVTRSHVRSLALAKRALPYTKDSDAAEWAAAMQYLARADAELHIEHLDLTVQALNPGSDSWDLLPDVSADWFRTAAGMGIFGREVGAMEDGLSWAISMHQIRGLKGIRIRACEERCFVPTSTGMAFWVGFSKSIENGFREWCWQEMVERTVEDAEGNALRDLNV